MSSCILSCSFFTSSFYFLLSLCPSVIVHKQDPCPISLLPTTVYPSHSHLIPRTEGNQETKESIQFQDYFVPVYKV